MNDVSVKVYAFSSCFSLVSLIFYASVRSVYNNVGHCFLFWHWVAPKQTVCFVRDVIVLRGFGGPTGCPWAWWWLAWRGWRTSWCLQTDQQGKPHQLLEDDHSGTLETQIGLEILSDFSHKTLEGQLVDQQLGGFLVTTNLTKSDSTRPVTIRFLDSTGSTGALLRAASRRRAIVVELYHQLIYEQLLCTCHVLEIETARTISLIKSNFSPKSNTSNSNPTSSILWWARNSFWEWNGTRPSEPVAIHLPTKNFRTSARKFWLNGWRPWLHYSKSRWEQIIFMKSRQSFFRFLPTRMTEEHEASELSRGILNLN